MKTHEFLSNFFVSLASKSCLRAFVVEFESGKGDVLSDVLWNGKPPASSESHVRSLTYCNLHSIRRESLLRILDFYESFVLSFARKMLLTFNLTTRVRITINDDVINALSFSFVFGKSMRYIENGNKMRFDQKEKKSLMKVIFQKIIQSGWLSESDP